MEEISRLVSYRSTTHRSFEESILENCKSVNELEPEKQNDSTEDSSLDVSTWRPMMEIDNMEAFESMLTQSLPILTLDPGLSQMVLFLLHFVFTGVSEDEALLL